MPNIIQQPTYFTVNGNRFQFSSLEINFGIPGFTIPTLGLQSISYKETLEPGELRGTSPAVLAFTTGKYSTEAKIKVPKAEAGYLVQQISEAAAANPDPLTGLIAGYGQYQWTATLNYFDIGQALQTDVLYGARIKSMSDDHKVGPDPLYTEIDLALMALSRNGFIMVDPETLGAAWGTN